MWDEQFSTGKEMREFPAKVTVVMASNVHIPTDTYDEYEQEYDEMTTRVVDTRFVEWEEEYKHNCITIEDLLHELKTYINEELRTRNITSSRERYLNRLMESCQGWVEQETIINEL